MDDAMTHETCSELLPRYVRGELAAEQSEEVRTHLETCDDCRAEERAAIALLSSDEPPMDDVERARLHRALAQELFAARANADVAGAATAPAREWTRWMAPALAAAAVLAGALVIATGGGTDDAADLGLSAPEREELGDDAGDAAESGGGAGFDAETRPHRSRAVRGTAATQESALAPAGPQPVFVANAGSVAADDLSELGRSGEPFRSFVESYAPEDGPDLYAGFLRGLAREAGGARREVEQCAATLPQDGTLLPAYAALARYEGKDALVLGFVTSDPGSESFDRYLMWVWARDSCRQPIDTLFEEVDAP